MLITPYKYSEFAGGVEVFSENLKKVFPDLFTITNAQLNSSQLNFRIGKFFQNNEGIRSLLLDRVAMKIMRHMPVDVVFVNGLYGWYLTLKKTEVPLINIFHGCYGGVANFILKKDRKLLYHYNKQYLGFMEHLSASGKVVVSVSEFVQDLLKQYYEIGSVVIPNGVDLETFKPKGKLDARKMLSLPIHRKIGVFVGPPSYSKGFDVVARLAKKNSSLLFIVISSKGSNSWISPNIISFSSVSHIDMPKFYSAADFFILPSRFEGCNLSILEAMACNLPILASNVGSFYRMAGPQSFGYIIPSEDVEEYQKALYDIVSMKNSFNSRGYVEQHYSLCLFESRYKALVRNLL